MIHSRYVCVVYKYLRIGRLNVCIENRILDLHLFYHFSTYYFEVLKVGVIQVLVEPEVVKLQNIVCIQVVENSLVQLFILISNHRLRHWLLVTGCSHYETTDIQDRYLLIQEVLNQVIYVSEKIWRVLLLMRSIVWICLQNWGLRTQPKKSNGSLHEVGTTLYSSAQNTDVGTSFDMVRVKEPLYRLFLDNRHSVPFHSERRTKIQNKVVVRRGLLYTIIRHYVCKGFMVLFFLN